jgi:hypothetical protein
LLWLILSTDDHVWLGRILATQGTIRATGGKITAQVAVPTAS